MNQESIVVLINRALPYNCVGRLTGRSGVEYGHSVYEDVHGAHVCRMSIAEWRACKQDVTYGFTRRWAQWEVDFEPAPTVEAAVTNEASGEGEESEVYTAEALAGVTHYRKLLSLARRAGVKDVDLIDSTAALREAILARQEEVAR